MYILEKLSIYYLIEFFNDFLQLSCHLNNSIMFADGVI